MTEADLGPLLREMRLRAGLTQEQLAEKIDATQQYISSVERGKNSPSWKYLFRLANTVGSNVVVLLRALGLIPAIHEGVEKQIAELVTEVPEFAELFEIARQAAAKDPGKLQEIVSLARWVMEK